MINTLLLTCLKYRYRKDVSSIYMNESKEEYEKDSTKTNHIEQEYLSTSFIMTIFFLFTFTCLQLHTTRYFFVYPVVLWFHLHYTDY